MWFLVIALLTGTGDYEGLVYEMPNYSECKLQMVGVKALDPVGDKYEATCEYVR